MAILEFIRYWVNDVWKKLAIPFYPLKEDETGHKYNVSTYWERLVSQYANISIFEVKQINIIDYWQLKFDAFIYQCNQSAKGQEYLDNAYRITQTSPQREKLREKFGKERKQNG